MSKANRALVIVDVQQDFCEGGSLAVDGGNATAVRIVEHLTRTAGRYEHVVFTKDWHKADSDNGGHFADEPDFTDTWPHHCVRGTEGAMWSKALADFVNAQPVAPVVFYKGQDAPAYSGFEGSTDPDGDPEAGTMLADWLREREVREVEVVGIAADYCVRATALDGVREGFKVAVLPDLTVGIHRDGQAVADEVEQAQSVEFVSESDHG